MGGGQGGALSKGGGGEQDKRRRRREEVSEYKQPRQYLWEPLGTFIFSKSPRHLKTGASNLFFFFFRFHRRRETSAFAPHLHVPEPQLGAVVRSAGDQVGVVGTPGQVGDPVGVTLQGSQQLQLVALLQHHMVGGGEGGYYIVIMTGFQTNKQTQTRTKYVLDNEEPNFMKYGLRLKGVSACVNLSDSCFPSASHSPRGHRIQTKT